MNDTTFQGNGNVKYVPVVVDAKPKPITNAMKIRAMSDEELAEFLYEYGGSSPNCNKNEMEYDYKSCHDCWLDWLRQEVADGETAL